MATPHTPYPEGQLTPLKRDKDLNLIFFEIFEIFYRSFFKISQNMARKLSSLKILRFLQRFLKRI